MVDAIEEKVGSNTGSPSPDDRLVWLHTLFPDTFPSDIPFADHHAAFWKWVDDLEPGERPRPFVAIWPRGGGKSTNAEAAAVYVGARETRRYVWYVSDTQDQADEHVENIGAMLESPILERYGDTYPLTQRKVGKYGHSKGWRRNRLRTAAGLTVDALGLDTARRGFKVEEQRPDLIILDDIDGELDTPETTEKKETIITKKILPAGAPDLAVVVVQNLIIPHGIVARLSDGRARYLARRIVSGPIPAVEGLETEDVDGRDIIVEGEPTWEGQSLDICQQKIDDEGLDSFMAECQHDVYGGRSQIFRPEWWSLEDGRNRYDWGDKKLRNLTAARYLFVDTAFKDKSTNDESAISVVELLKDYRLVLRWVWHDRVESAFLPDKIEDVARRFSKDDKLQGVVIEDKGSGTTSIQTLRAAAPAWLASLIGEFTPHGTKEYRARNASVWCGRGCVLLPYPHGALDGWYADFLDDELGQLFRFPQAPHDDMVDTLVMAILYLEHYLQVGWKKRSGLYEEEAAGKGRPVKGGEQRGRLHPRIAAATKKRGR